MFSAFVSKLGGIVAPVEDTDRHSRSRLSEMPVTISDDSSGSLNPYHSSINASRISTSTSFKTSRSGDATADKADQNIREYLSTESVSTEITVDGQHRGARRFSWMKDSTVSTRSGSQIINNENLYTLTTGVSSNSVAAEIPIEGVLSNCNQLLETVEKGLRHDRYYAQSLLQDLAYSQHLNKMLLTQSSSQKNTNKILDVALLGNSDSMVTFNGTEDLLKAKMDVTDQLFKLRKQLSAEQQRAEEEEVIKSTAWKARLSTVKNDADYRIEELERLLHESQQLNLTLKDESAKMTTAYKEELRRTMKISNQCLDLLKQQLAASQQRCINVESSLLEIQVEYTAMKEQRSVCKICQKLLEDSPSSSYTNSPYAEIMASSHGDDSLNQLKEEGQRRRVEHKIDIKRYTKIEIEIAENITVSECRTVDKDNKIKMAEVIGQTAVLIAAAKKETDDVLLQLNDLQAELRDRDREIHLRSERETALEREMSLARESARERDACVLVLRDELDNSENELVIVKGIAAEMDKVKVKKTGIQIERERAHVERETIRSRDIDSDRDRDAYTDQSRERDAESLRAVGALEASYAVPRP